MASGVLRLLGRLAHGFCELGMRCIATALAACVSGSMRRANLPPCLCSKSEGASSLRYRTRPSYLRQPRLPKVSPEIESPIYSLNKFECTVDTSDQEFLTLMCCEYEYNAQSIQAFCIMDSTSVFAHFTGTIVTCKFSTCSR